MIKLSLLIIMSLAVMALGDDSPGTTYIKTSHRFYFEHTKYDRLQQLYLLRLF